MTDTPQPSDFHVQLQRSYPGEFVAIREARVVAHARTHGGLVKALHQEGIDRTEVTFMRVDSPGIVCVYRFPTR
jgi:hypothetical protein